MPLHYSRDGFSVSNGVQLPVIPGGPSAVVLGLDVGAVQKRLYRSPGLYDSIVVGLLAAKPSCRRSI